MKVIRIIARLNVGGPARHVALLNAGLDARGHQTVLVHGSIDKGEASLEHLAHEQRLATERIEPLGRSIRAGSDIRAFVALLRILFHTRPDVVHTHTAKAGVLGRLAAVCYNATRRASRRAIVVHTFHGHVFEGYFPPLISRLVRTTERTLARSCDRIVVISARQRDDLVTRWRIVPERKAVIIPLGLDLEGLLSLERPAPDLRATIGATADDVIVGFAGRMVPIKDLDTLLRGFAWALARAPRLRLILAGDGPERARLEALVKTLGITGRVTFLGWTEDLPRFCATIDIGALSSINEGTPVALIEAMASAAPVVATAVGGVADVVADGVTGLLVSPGDARAFSDALVDLALDPERRSAFGRAGREKARVFSVARLVNDIERLYEAALQERRHQARA